MKLQLPHSGSQGKGAKHNKKLGLCYVPALGKNRKKGQTSRVLFFPSQFHLRALPLEGEPPEFVSAGRQRHLLPALVGNPAGLPLEQNLLLFFEPTERTMVLGPRMHRRGNGRDLTPPASASEMGFAAPGMIHGIPVSAWRSTKKETRSLN